MTPLEWGIGYVEEERMLGEIKTGKRRRRRSSSKMCMWVLLLKVVLRT
jgi:hypothetical protein